MEKRDVIVLLLLAGGGAYAIHDNWDVIAERMGLEQLDPGRLKAIKLAKNSGCIGRGQTNWQHIQSRRALGKIHVESDPWLAEPIAGQDFRVTVRWLDEDQELQITHTFLVNTVACTVTHEGMSDVPAAPQ